MGFPVAAQDLLDGGLYVGVRQIVVGAEVKGDETQAVEGADLDDPVVTVVDQNVGRYRSCRVVKREAEPEDTVVGALSGTAGAAAGDGLRALEKEVLLLAIAAVPVVERARQQIAPFTQRLLARTGHRVAIERYFPLPVFLFENAQRPLLVLREYLREPLPQTVRWDTPSRPPRPRTRIEISSP